jgi:hypothetical protein
VKVEPRIIMLPVATPTRIPTNPPPTADSGPLFAPAFVNITGMVSVTPTDDRIF